MHIYKSHVFTISNKNYTWLIQITTHPQSPPSIMTAFFNNSMERVFESVFWPTSRKRCKRDTRRHIQDLPDELLLEILLYLPVEVAIVVIISNNYLKWFEIYFHVICKKKKTVPLLPLLAKKLKTHIQLSETNQSQSRLTAVPLALMRVWIMQWCWF